MKKVVLATGLPLYIAFVFAADIQLDALKAISLKYL